MALVLLVEDETEIAELIRDVMTAEGLEVITANSDTEAYSVLESGAASLAALVADINLGRGTTGYDVARRARQLNPSLPVVYITSHERHAGRFGVEDGILVLKPFLPSDLAGQVRALIAPTAESEVSAAPVEELGPSNP